jgi:FtsP/CotA-like multicopper oxidase with cupredoxin domain
MSSSNLSTSKGSGQAFLLGGAGFLGGTALVYGCESVSDNANFGIVATGENNKTPLAPKALREISLDVRPAEIEIASGRRINAWTYDGKFPGTEIRAKEGERLRITSKNNLPEDTSLHWPGIQQKGTNNVDGT